MEKSRVGQECSFALGQVRAEVKGTGTLRNRPNKHEMGKDTHEQKMSSPQSMPYASAFDSRPASFRTGRHAR